MCLQIVWVINYNSIIVPLVDRKKRRGSFIGQENHWYLLTEDWEDVKGRVEDKKDQRYDKINGNDKRWMKACNSSGGSRMI